MFINIFNSHAEQKLLSLLEKCNKRHRTLAVLYFQFSKLPDRPSEASLLETLRPLLLDKSSAIYFFHNGDIVITWYGTQRAIIDQVIETLYMHFSSKTDKNLHKYYDSCTQGGAELAQLLRELIKALPEHLQSSAADTNRLEFTPAQLQHMRKCTSERRTFGQPSILIVEDQEFSRNLLDGLLRKDHPCYSVGDAHDAVRLYAEHAPCITFIDIQLPDINGHDLAEFIKRYDPDSYIVMVTANHFREDVEHARANHVQGFIVKPYNKQKIMESIHRYQSEKKAS